MSYMSKNELVQGRELKVQRLSIPFSITASATPSAVLLRTDEPEILYMQSQGVNQITPAGGNISDFTTPTSPSGSPDLGTSSTYGILASSAISNTGNTVVTGDLGLSPGTSVTGYPPGIVIGVQNITNAAAAQAKIDALAAYSDLSTRSSTVIPSALDGQTLTAGVYSFASGAATLATSANGTLTFSGSATDIFVIKTATTLTTGAGGTPTIAFTGGALPSNVYWAIGSSATLNVSATGAFKGTLIAQVSVTVNGGSVDGRLMALTGALTFAAAVILTVTPSGYPLNMLIKLRPEDRCFKVMKAGIWSRTNGTQQSCLFGDADGIDSDENIILTMNSSLNPATTDFDGCVEVDYVVVE